MKLLVDMNLTPRWVPYLAAAGFESRHWPTCGESTATDRSITTWARNHGYIILTNDLDFPQILAHTRDHGPSVVLLRGEPLTPESRGPGLIATLHTCRDELARGAIASLHWDDQFRVRMLPIR